MAVDKNQADFVFHEKGKPPEEATKLLAETMIFLPVLTVYGLCMRTLAMQRL